MQKEIKVIGTDYTQDVATPLVAGDYNAYVITMPVSSSDSVTGFMVTAQKHDGTVIVDSGTVADNVCRYTIKTNMYDIPGEVLIRVAPTANDAKLTVRELRFTAIADFGESQEVPADRLPALTSAIAYAREQGDYAAAECAKLHATAATKTSSFTFDCSKDQCVIYNGNKVGTITITNAYAGAKGTILVAANSQVIRLPDLSYKASDFPSPIVLGPYRYDFIYDGYRYWWSCKKYNV